MSARIVVGRVERDRAIESCGPAADAECKGIVAAVGLLDDLQLSLGLVVNSDLDLVRPCWNRDIEAAIHGSRGYCIVIRHCGVGCDCPRGAAKHRHDNRHVARGQIPAGRQSRFADREAATGSSRKGRLEGRTSN